MSKRKFTPWLARNLQLLQPLDDCIAETGCRLLIKRSGWRKLIGCIGGLTEERKCLRLLFAMCCRRVVMGRLRYVFGVRGRVVVQYGVSGR